MVAGVDRYFQIVKCFRDEDLRADRQPEFTQIDCEMSFIEQEDILNMFEGLVKYLFKNIKDLEIPSLPRLSYDEAMKFYGNDKPDTRFEMKIVELKIAEKINGIDAARCPLFTDAPYVGGICVKGAAEYTRKQLDELTEFVKRPQLGASGLVYIRYNLDGSLKSSIDKFYPEQEHLKKFSDAFNAQPGDLMLILFGTTAGKPSANNVRKALSELRLEMGQRLGLREKGTFSCLWVTDFPLFEKAEADDRLYAMHHPFTAPKPDDRSKLDSNPELAKANAYDLVINGVEIGGGSIRIHDKNLQAKMFKLLGFTPEEAQAQFGFLMNAFEYGAPPHGGIAFGFDRLCAVFAGVDSIRDFIAFPKNNSGRDVMIDAPSAISQLQFKELGIDLKSQIVN
jgi:aspartyl-tRNA synthetase